MNRGLYSTLENLQTLATPCLSFDALCWGCLSLTARTPAWSHGNARC
jgi:hypothetical protein